MKFLMVFSMVSMAPLFGENTLLFDMKNWPLAQLRASSSLRYPELLCKASVIWLHD